MNAKDEFFKLIESSFTENEINKIKIRCDELEKQIGPDSNKITYLYYNLSGLYYTSSKDFTHFYINFAKDKMALNCYTKKTLNYKIKKERELQSAFYSLYEKIMYFKDINNDFKELLNSNKNKSKDIIMALCNALYEEIENYKDIEKKLKAYNDYYNLSQLIDSINNPKNPSEKIILDRLNIEYSIHDENNRLKENEKITITSKEVIDNLKFALINYISFTTPDQLDKKYLFDKKEDASKIRKKHVHRIINRILIITNHYKLKLVESTKKKKEEEEEKNIYTNKFLNLIYEFINYIGIDTSTRSNKNNTFLTVDEARSFVKKRLDIKDNDNFTEKDIRTFFPKLY